MTAAAKKTPAIAPVVAPSAPAPLVVKKQTADDFDYRHLAVLGMGVVGGIGISGMAYDWYTDKSRQTKEKRDDAKQIAAFAFSMSVLYVTAQMPWGKWFDANKVGAEADKAIAEALK